jgi:hypothetical protein
MQKKVRKALDELAIYCKKEEFKGYDPYDGLNSTFFQSFPYIPGNRIARLVWIQAFKRSPFNLRPLCGIKKEYNPKALGLFLSGYCALYKSDAREEYLTEIHFLISKILELVSPGKRGASWGYNFDWESKAFFQPKFTPTIVVSSFIANSLLDAYEIVHDEKLLRTARSTCDYILKDLNRTYNDDGNFAFSYSSIDKSVVFNASLLGSKLLARVFSITGEPILKEEAKKSLNYCCGFQHSDGSWAYGLLPFHQWIDNFHTGYNLECISDYMRFTGDHSYEINLKSGLEYYLNTFFSKNGIPRYYSNSVYPIDIHAPAQLVITLFRLGKFCENKELIDSVLNWTILNMKSDKGYFYYQKNRFFTSKIPYMRWSQAWMFYAFSTYLLQISEEAKKPN